MTELERLISAIDETGVSVTFGLQKHHIEKIEDDIKKFDSLLSEGDLLCKGWRKWDASFWEKWGREFNWQPLTLALHYFNYLEHKEQ